MLARRWKQVAAMCALAIAGGAHADAANTGTKAPISHDTLWLMPRVAPPVASPDGRLAVVQVVEPAYDSKDQRSDLWQVATDGRSPPRRLTADPAVESAPVFSPDGRRLAFIAKRSGDEAAQVYVLDLDGGEAQRVTSISTGARAPQFSPDGRRILFVSDVDVGVKTDADQRRIDAERKARDYNARVYTGFPIRNWDRWIGERRPQVFVQSLDGGEAANVLAGSALVASSGYAGRGGLGSEELDTVWAPDGQSVLFVASRNRHRSAYSFTHLDIWQVPATGGEPRRLTGGEGEDADDGYSTLRFSRDGTRLFALLNPRSDSVYNATRLVRFDWPSMAGRRVLEAPGALSVSTYAIALPAGEEALLSAETAGQEAVFRGGFDGKPARMVARPEHGLYTNLALGGTGRDAVLLGSFESATQPPEIVRIDPARGTHTALTRFAAPHAEKLDLAPLETFWFERDGRRIHNMLLRPPGFDPAKKYPLLVLMHGGPHTMWRDMWVLRWNYHLLAAPGYVVLLTNYTGSTGFGEAFARGIIGDPLRGPALDINQAADEAIARYSFIDGERQCAGGASYGGHLANWLQGTTDRYRCLISHAGLVNLESQWGTSDIAWSREAANGGPVWEQGAVWREQNPIRLAANFKTPTLVTFGEKDFRVPINNGLEYWAALQRQQVESRLVVFPDENHWILKGGNSRYFYQEVHDWLARWLED
ncbi:S9 family peptidase [Xanthomonadaceae bacterium JHOS43]|nr:S9 family peptidase [Xanthomonadaceae bacterium JHOS43]